MHCPNCGFSASPDQKFCGSCGLSMPEFSKLLDEKLPNKRQEIEVKKRKAQTWGLRLWTIAGAILYIALYWAIISEIIIGKGHVLGGVLFLLLITIISIGGLLLLYSLAIERRSAYRSSSQPQVSDTTQELMLDERTEPTVPVTDRTTELLRKDDSNEKERRTNAG